MNTYKLCEIVYNTQRDIDECFTIYEMCLSEGLENIVYKMIMQQYSLYWNLSIGIEEAGIRVPRYDEKQMNYFDLYKYKINYMFDKQFEIFDVQIYSLFKEVKMFDIYDFVIQVVCIVVIVLVVFRILFNISELSLWKAKSMVGILPTNYMMEHFTEIEQFIKKTT